MKSKKQLIENLISAGSLTSQVVEYMDQLSRELSDDKRFKVSIDRHYIAVHVEDIGFYLALVTSSSSEVALREFSLNTNVTLEDVEGVKPLLDEAKTLLIKMHKEVQDVITNGTANGYSVQDVREFLEGKGSSPSVRTDSVQVEENSSEPHESDNG